jgi:hypothetical protein
VDAVEAGWAQAEVVMVGEGHSYFTCPIG